MDQPPPLLRVVRHRHIDLERHWLHVVGHVLPCRRAVPRPRHVVPVHDRAALGDDADDAGLHGGRPEEQHGAHAVDRQHHVRAVVRQLDHLPVIRDHGEGGDPAAGEVGEGAPVASLPGAAAHPAVVRPPGGEGVAGPVVVLPPLEGRRCSGTADASSAYAGRDQGGHVRRAFYSAPVDPHIARVQPALFKGYVLAGVLLIFGNRRRAAVTTRVVHNGARDVPRGGGIRAGRPRAHRHAEGHMDRRALFMDALDDGGPSRGDNCLRIGVLADGGLQQGVGEDPPRRHRPDVQLRLSEYGAAHERGGPDRHRLHGPRGGHVLPDSGHARPLLRPRPPRCRRRLLGRRPSPAAIHVERPAGGVEAHGGGGALHAVVRLRRLLGRDRERGRGRGAASGRYAHSGANWLGDLRARLAEVSVAAFMLVRRWRGEVPSHLG
mmetsp:Transcript_9513/g.27533  ORF Transcript_9513/g.27533 Transcript_9513/m.27533 type:complete len:435 (-) Transcript_9513:901-2205(-)